MLKIKLVSLLRFSVGIALPLTIPLGGHLWLEQECSSGTLGEKVSPCP